jgi:hypothetical protein
MHPLAGSITVCIEGSRRAIEAELSLTRDWPAFAAAPLGLRLAPATCYTAQRHYRQQSRAF